MTQLWVVTIQWRGDELPLSITATGRDPDEALTDCERRGHYFPAEGDRITRVAQLPRRQKA